MERDGPFDDVRVLELANMLAAPYAGHLLADYGAEVVKVEDANRPDASRDWWPMKDGVALGFLRANSGKRSIAVDLRRPVGQELIRRLAARFDVIIEAFRPGRMADWGLSSDVLREINPRLVVLHVSGYGQTGPSRSKPGFGTIAESVSGFAYVNGWPETPPTVAPFGLGDQIAGLASAFAVAAALFQRERTGMGEDVDTALYEPIMNMLGDVILRYSATGEIQERAGSLGKQTSPRGVYETKDGKWVAIAGSAQAVVARLFDAMGQPELIHDERYATNDTRVQHDEELQKMMRDWVADHSRQELLEKLDAYGVAAGPINSAKDIVETEHFLVRQSLVQLHSQVLGAVLVPGLIAKLASLDSVERQDAPAHGAHTAAVLQAELGLTDVEIRELQDANIVYDPALSMAVPTSGKKA